MLLDYMLVRFNRIVSNLVVYEEVMMKNIHLTHGVIFAQRVMTTLIETGGMSREGAYDFIHHYRCAHSIHPNISKMFS
ncbi:hypothetical protein MGH68_09825 [Erysipelothrix sp. D19-032]